ncbi:MAG: lipoate--protein ligase family protein [Candidatus Omnitrophica bacterium]|nr:lipoate--protein ligase family protein [Candidatus Omnitrophota bacterium]
MSKPLIFCPMQVKDFTFKIPQENILYDELLLQLADKHGHGEVLRFWESSEIFIVLGMIGNEHEDIWLERTKEDNIPVLRRTSGGGTVVQGPGCLNYTLVLEKQRHLDLNDLRKSYSWISSRVIDALKECGVEAIFRPISDIALASGEKKISGTAQHRGKNFILHHGTILCDFNLNLIGRYLKMPKDIPDYRKNRPHEDFVTNIHVAPKPFKQALGNVFGLNTATVLQSPSPQEVLALRELLQKRQVVVGA